MTVGVYCADLNADMNTWGPCIQETMFLGDAMIMGAIIFAIFVVLIWKLRLPGETALPLGILISLGLYLSNPVGPFFILLVAALMAMFGWIALVIVFKFTRS